MCLCFSSPKQITVGNSPELFLSPDSSGSVERNPKCSGRTARTSCNRRASSACAWTTASGCPCRTSLVIFRLVFSTPFGWQTNRIGYNVLFMLLFSRGQGRVLLKIDQPDPKQTPIGKIKMSVPRGWATTSEFYYINIYYCIRSAPNTLRSLSLKHGVYRSRLGVAATRRLINRKNRKIVRNPVMLLTCSEHTRVHGVRT